MSAKRHPDDQTVERHMESDGLHVFWEDRETGERYGGVFPGEVQRAILLEEGVNPDEFWPHV